MEFLEAPAFTRYASGYLTDDEYRELQNRLAVAPEHGDVEQEDFGSFVGQTQDAVKDEEAVCESSIITSQANNKSG
jgi:hypothetical protein